MASLRPPRDRTRRARQGARRNRRPPARKRNRLVRTILLGTLAVAFALIWLARELDLDRDELLGYLATSALFVAIPIGFGIVGAAVLWLLKRARR